MNMKWAYYAEATRIKMKLMLLGLGNCPLRSQQPDLDIHKSPHAQQPLLMP